MPASKLSRLSVYSVELNTPLIFSLPILSNSLNDLPNWSWVSIIFTSDDVGFGAKLNLLVSLLSRPDMYPPTNEELLKLAEKSIGFNNSKQKAEIPYFEEMIEFRIIKESKPVLGYYYLIQSTPFWIYF